MKHFPRTISLLGLLLLTNSCGGDDHRLGEGADGLGERDGNTGGDAGAGNTGGSGSDSTDPCDGVTLPACPPQCGDALGSMAGSDCSEGDECVTSAVGDGCECSGGQWQCSVHPPLDPNGCNLVCDGGADGGGAGGAGGAAGGGGSDPNDPCDGVSLPECAPRCEGNMGELAGQPCTPGDECIITTVGDECACGSDGTWGCSVHPPLGMGCNLTCDDGD